MQIKNKDLNTIFINNKDFKASGTIRFSKKILKQMKASEERIDKAMDLYHKLIFNKHS